MIRCLEPAPYRSATGAYRLWQLLSFAHKSRYRVTPHGGSGASRGARTRNEPTTSTLSRAAADHPDPEQPPSHRGEGSRPRDAPSHGAAAFERRGLGAGSRPGVAGALPFIIAERATRLDAAEPFQRTRSSSLSSGHRRSARCRQNGRGAQPPSRVRNTPFGAFQNYQLSATFVCVRPCTP